MVLPPQSASEIVKQGLGMVGELMILVLYLLSGLFLFLFFRKLKHAAQHRDAVCIL